MLSLRILSHAVPRALGRVSTPSSLQLVRRLGAGDLVAPRAMRGPVAWRAALSTSAHEADEADGETDEELSSKLESEIQLEQEIKSSEQQPVSIKDFLDSCPFQLVDNAGQEIVKLERKFGDESITVSFSVADINYDPYAEDTALDDGEPGLDGDSMDKMEKRGADSPAVDDAQDDGHGREDMDEESATPINLSIVIEKPGKTAGALSIDATAQDGNIVVDNMFFYDDAKVAKISSPEHAQKRSEIYPGPPFGSLDEDLQVLMERFLEERGINQALAVFIPDYVDVKEQKEYLRWLRNVKAFVDA